MNGINAQPQRGFNIKPILTFQNVKGASVPVEHVPTVERYPRFQNVPPVILFQDSDSDDE